MTTVCMATGLRRRLPGSSLPGWTWSPPRRMRVCCLGCPHSLSERGPRISGGLALAQPSQTGLDRLPRVEWASSLCEGLGGRRMVAQCMVAQCAQLRLLCTLRREKYYLMASSCCNGKTQPCRIRPGSCVNFRSDPAPQPQTRLQRAALRLSLDLSVPLNTPAPLAKAFSLGKISTAKEKKISVEGGIPSDTALFDFGNIAYN